MWSKRTERYTKRRMRGGASTGPKTAEGLKKCRLANWKHGDRSAATIAERLAFRSKMSLWNLAMGYLARDVRAWLSYRHPFGAAIPPDKRREESNLRARLENFQDAIDDDLESVGGDTRCARLLNLSLRGLELLARLDGRLPDPRRRPKPAPWRIAELLIGAGRSNRAALG
jgi:hypothetical protein